jgi:hypothetical protein
LHPLEFEIGRVHPTGLAAPHLMSRTSDAGHQRAAVAGP